MVLLKIVLVTVIVFSIFIKFYQHISFEKLIESIRNDIKNMGYSFEIVDINKKYFSITTENTVFIIRLLKVIHNCQIVINNKTAWQLNYGNLHKVGKTPKSSVRISKINDFMESDFKNFSDKEIQKVVVVYPKIHSILRYLNESEIDYVKPNNNIYGVNIVRLSDLNNYICNKEK